jgi:1D-myo-inositol-triphosphate 3-kinase
VYILLQIIGSSLLFVHDASENVSVWMIDFGKSVPIPESISVDHRSPWVEGNHEDGYLFGLDGLISLYEELLESVSPSSMSEGDGE